MPRARRQEAPEAARSGLLDLDRSLGGFQPGDNVVWAAEAGTFANVFTDAFVNARGGALSGSTVVFVNANHAPQEILRRYERRSEPGCRWVHVDAFTNGKGRGDPLFQGFYRQEPAEESSGFESLCVENPADTAAFHRTLSAVEERCGERVRYVFNSLTGLGELWGGERAVQAFFTHHCPKLYELETVAYWILEREAHSAAFLANLSHITQVVVRLENRQEGFCRLSFLKAEDRPSSVLEASLRYRVADGRVEFLGRTPPERTLRVGARIRELRAGLGLSQAELARRLEITPSALCQIENNQVHPSLPLLIDLSGLLGCSLDGFFPDQTAGRSGAGTGWTVFKKRDQGPLEPGKGSARPAFEARPLLPERSMGLGLSPYLVRLERGAEGVRAFFDHKGPEFGWVAGGILKVSLPGGEVTLRKGDSILLEDQALKRWKVEGSGRCELLWVLGP